MKTTNKKEWPVAIKSIVLAMAGAGLVSLPYMASANPTGGQVVAGNVTIRQESATKIGITQTTAKGIIDWQKYSIGANEHVQYYQPSASSVTLNRVVGQDPSQILGRLTANGQIFLVNPNGIFFGKNAQVDVAGLVASTHNIRNEDFLAGKYNFNIPGKPGASVINEGTIRIADTGIAAFVAPSVANRGVIVARLGKVAMAAANGFTLDFHGDQLLSFLVKDDVAQTAFDIDGKQLTSFVENSGRIEAQGGYVLLSAKAAENAIHGVINHSGVIEATTVGTKNGEIILHAGTGSLQVSGTLDASAPNGGDGGFIETSGAQLSISPDIKITTLAATGKNGSWLIDPFNILIGTGGISPNALNTASSNIILEATNDITFQSPVSVTQAGVGLTAKAGRNIQVDANISTNNGEINLLAGFDSFTNAAGVNDGKVIINGARVNSGTAARNIIGRGPSTDGLVGYWTFNGNAKDGSGNANNGSSLGNVTFTSDGTRDIVKFGGYYSPGSVVVANNSSLHFSSNMTLSYWVRIDSRVGMNGYGGPATIGSVGTTVAKSHDRSGFFSLMGTGSNGEYYSTFGNDVYRSTSAGVSSLTGESTANSIGQWVHVAYTFSANEAKIYIDGTLKSSVSRPINFSIANTQNLYFGKFSDSWYPLNGALDEVRLYNQTLSSNRISEIYSGATPPVTPPVVTKPIISESFIATPKEEVFIASSVSYAFKNPLTETGDVFDQFVGGKIKSKTESVPVNADLAYFPLSNEFDSAQFSGAGSTVRDFKTNVETKHILLGKNWFGNMIWPTTSSEIKDGSIIFRNEKPVAVTAIFFDSVTNTKIEFIIPPSIGGGPISTVADFFETPINGGKGLIDFVESGGARSFKTQLPPGLDLSQASVVYKLGDQKSTVLTCIGMASTYINMATGIADLGSGGNIPVSEFKEVISGILKNAAADTNLTTEIYSIIQSPDRSMTKAANVVDKITEFMGKELEKALIDLGAKYYSNGLPSSYLKKIENAMVVIKAIKGAAIVEKAGDLVQAVNYLAAFPEEKIVEMDNISTKVLY